MKISVNIYARKNRWFVSYRFPLWPEKIGPKGRPKLFLGLSEHQICPKVLVRCTLVRTLANRA